MDTTDSKQGERKCILLVEDNPANMLVTNDFLENHGYQVVTASNGFDAIETAQMHQPDLILMDIQMPGMNGFEAIKRLREKPQFDSVSIIALTALVMPGDRERCLEAGANEYLAKPVSLKELLQTVQSLLT
jgi:CheY-like chemotaxis protein